MFHVWLHSIFISQARGNSRITRDNPFLEDADCKHLDKDGIVLPGTVVTANLVAVSAVSPPPPSMANHEKRLLAAILGNADEQQVRDDMLK